MQGRSAREKKVKHMALLKQLSYLGHHLWREHQHWGLKKGKGGRKETREKGDACVKDFHSYVSQITGFKMCIFCCTMSFNGVEHWFNLRAIAAAADWKY